jgi:hypothetical protein
MQHQGRDTADRRRPRGVAPAVANRGESAPGRCAPSVNVCRDWRPLRRSLGLTADAPCCRARWRPQRPLEIILYGVAKCRHKIEVPFVVTGETQHKMLDAGGRIAAQPLRQALAGTCIARLPFSYGCGGLAVVAL